MGCCALGHGYNNWHSRLQEAKENFNHSPSIIEALLRYEPEIESYFKEHEEN